MQAKQNLRVKWTEEKFSRAIMQDLVSRGFFMVIGYT